MTGSARRPNEIPSRHDLRPERVLVIHERYRQRGGEDVVVEAEVELLRAAGHEVERVDVDHSAIPDDATLTDRLRLAASTVWSRAGVERVRRAVRTFNPDIVHAHNTFPLLSPAVLGAARALGPAVVQTLHNYRLVCANALLLRDGLPCEDCVGMLVPIPGVVHGCYRDSTPASAVVVAMLAVHRARGTWRSDVDWHIALASFARDRLVRGGVPRDRISIVPNFVPDPGRHAVPSSDRVLFVGRLAADKGVETLLEAWRRTSPQGELRIAGDGPLGGAVDAAAAGDPTIRPLGRLDPVGILEEMRGARAIVVPSTTYENCPLTVLEAFAAARPVVASNHGGLSELVDHGRTGLLSPPGSPAELAVALDRAVRERDEMDEMGRAARARYEERYTPEIAHARLREVFGRARLHRGHPIGEPERGP